MDELMRRLFLLICMAVFPVITFSQGQGAGCELYPTLIDSVLVARWDQSAGIWNGESVSHYHYDGSRLSDILYMDASRELQSRWADYYDTSGNVVLQLLTTWDGSEWKESQKKMSVFSVENRKETELILNLRNGVWVFRAFYEYRYDDGRLSRIVYRLQDREGNMYDHLYYDYQYEGGIVRRIVTRDPSTGTDIRVEVYDRDEEGRVSELTLYNIESDTFGGEVNQIPVTRRVYDYGEFGLLREVILMNYNEGIWVNTTRSVYYRKVDTARKVTVCHNGNTICISVNALPAHLAIGSVLGACRDDGGKRVVRDMESEKPPFTVFPNPATDRITVRIESQSAYLSGVLQLTDFRGRLLRSVKIEGQNEVILYRQGLKDGKYIIRLVGDQTWQTVVIFN